MSGFMEFSWPIDDAGEAGPAFEAVEQALAQRKVHFEAYLATDHTMDRKVLRVLVDDAHDGDGGVTADELQDVVGQASSTHEFHGTVAVRYEIEAAQVHTDGADPIAVALFKGRRHRWWHRW